MEANVRPSDLEIHNFFVVCLTTLFSHVYYTAQNERAIGYANVVNKRVLKEAVVD
jgi:hypothetical protein